VDHRVEPPSWLPQGAAPQAADPEANDSPAPDSAQSPEEDSASVANAAQERPGGNGRDGSYAYSGDDYYGYGQEASFEAEDSSYEAPPHSRLNAEPETRGGGKAADTLDGGVEGAEPGDGVAAGRPYDDGTGYDPGPGYDVFSRGAADGGYGGSGAAAAAGGAAAASSGVAAPGTPENGVADAGFSDGAPRSGYAPTAPYGPGYPADAPGYSTDTPAYPGDQAVADAAAVQAPKRTRASLSYRRPPKARKSKAARPVTTDSGPRRANLVVARLEPWSVMKFSFLLSLVAWLVLFVAVALLYYALSSLGVFHALQKTLASVTSSQGSGGVDLTKWTSATRVLGYTMLIGAVDVVLITALSTVGAVIYNLVTHLGGGIEITLKETE
jgi:Transmembrane domain of unknown function (DUF3566)